MNFSSIKNEISLNRYHYLILALLLFLALLVRTYRMDALLRFYYDQGRDALIIKEMLETPKPVLVGPTTGLAGILRGPAFYYLLAPAYLIGRGDPVVAALWLQLLNVIGLVFVYLAAKKLYGRLAGLIAVSLLGFSWGIVDLSRWLSNPSPIFLSVPIMIYGLVKIKKQENSALWWPVVALMLGLNLQFEIASEIWFLPAVALLVLVDRDMRPSWRIAALSTAIFFATLLPQVIFDLRHDGILRQGIIQNFSASKTPAFAFNQQVITERLNQYLDIFAGMLVQRQHDLVKMLILFTLLIAGNLAFRHSSQILAILLLVPLTILVFYQGNYGNFYSYYLIGTFPIFLLLLSGVLSWYWRHPGLRVLVTVFLAFFLYKNGVLLKNTLIAGYDGPEHISLGNQLQAIDWIYQDASGKPFNVDVYVPPVIPYAYDYLIPWYGQKEYDQKPKTEQVDLLYTLYEVDPPHPERLAAWVLRQAGIGEVEEYVRFGGIVVQRRQRY